MGHNKPPYYITAYGIAVKQGFKGTVDEWLASLQGGNVELRNIGGRVQWRRVGSTEALGIDENWQDLFDISEVMDGICYFGIRYDDAEQVIDLNAEGTVQMYLFPTADGYDAVVTGGGEIMDFAAPTVEKQNAVTGLIDVTVTENRPYAECVPRIARMHIEEGVTSRNPLNDTDSW